MEAWIEYLKVVLYGIVEGITEWLPISSTGHMILLEEWVKLDVSAAFWEMFLVVIQLGAILAVIVVFFQSVNPFGHKTGKQRREVFGTWWRVIIGCIPAGVIGVLFNDWFDEHFYNAYVVAAMLILYGLLFIIVENTNQNRRFNIRSFSQMPMGTAFAIGCVQVLALIPGTSRSGATILGAMLFGVSRPIAAEYSFLLSVPIMAGASLIKLVKFGFNFSGNELVILLIGMISAFVVSIAAIKFLVGYVKNHDFKIFGYYRIILGIVVLAYFLLIK